VASCIKLEGERSEEAQNDGVKVAVQAAAKPAAAKSVKKK
jgi:hypothetical protein